LAVHYDVTIITVSPNMHPQALAELGKTLPGDKTLLACWYCDIGALNQIMIIRGATDAASIIETRQATLTDKNPFGIGSLITAMTMDTYVSFDFMAPMTPAKLGPCYEVRSYTLKYDGLAATAELWRQWVPRRATVSPVLAAMTAVTGPAIRFMHIWPYPSLDERVRLRTKAVADGVWPPPGGPTLLASQQSDIYLPAPFSPLK
jgi:hypothetical protein